VKQLGWGLAGLVLTLVAAVSPAWPLAVLVVALLVALAVKVRDGAGWLLIGAGLGVLLLGAAYGEQYDPCTPGIGPGNSGYRLFGHHFFTCNGLNPVPFILGGSAVILVGVVIASLGASPADRREPPASWIRITVPCVFLFLALGASVLAFQVTAPAACSSLPQAFSHGVHTTTEDDSLGIYASCTVTENTTGVVTSEIDINWSTVVASLAFCIGAWSIGAILTGVIDRKRGTLVVGGAAVAWLFAVIAFFA